MESKPKEVCSVSKDGKHRWGPPTRSGVQECICGNRRNQPGFVYPSRDSVSVKKLTHEETE